MVAVSTLVSALGAHVASLPDAVLGVGFLDLFKGRTPQLLIGTVVLFVGSGVLYLRGLRGVALLVFAGGMMTSVLHVLGPHTNIQYGVGSGGGGMAGLAVMLLLVVVMPGAIIAHLCRRGTRGALPPTRRGEGRG